MRSFALFFMAIFGIFVDLKGYGFICTTRVEFTFRASAPSTDFRLKGIFGRTSLENHFYVRSASLRAGLRRAEGSLSSVPSTYEPACAQTPTLARRAGLLYFALPGWCFVGSTVSQHLHFEIFDRFRLVRRKPFDPRRRAPFEHRIGRLIADIETILLA